MKINPSSFLTRTLNEAPGGGKITRILSAALEGVDPTQLIQDSVSKQGELVAVLDEKIDLRETEKLDLLGIGKAALPMSLALTDLLAGHLQKGFILTKGAADPLPGKYQDQLKLFSGSHPVPSDDGLKATRQILQGLSSYQERDLVLVLISGGGSALFTQPTGKISLNDLQKTNQLLLDCGADIREINIIRKHLSKVKGGLFAKHLFPARVLTLILSDVMGDPIDMIASGPTSPDPSTYQDALGVVTRYRLADLLPHRVIEHLELGQEAEIPETPKPGDPIFNKVKNIILASNQDARQTAAAAAIQEGFQTTILPHPLEGEAREVGMRLAQKLKGLAHSGQSKNKPICLIAGGETTVTLTNTDQPGIGGRNLELALGALPILDGLEHTLLVTLATDGEDGTTGAAGAVVSGESYKYSQQKGLEPEEYLTRHDSYTFFDSLDDLLRIGSTGTNVNDLCLMFIQ